MAHLYSLKHIFNEKLFTFCILFVSVSFIKAQLPQLWGTTVTGGSNSQGTLLTLRADNTNFAVEHNFGGIDNAASPQSTKFCKAANGLLYGMTSQGGSANYGTIFSFNPITRVYTGLYDFNDTTGSDPWGSLIQAGNGLLYGMASQGGANFSGVLFSFDPVANTYTDLYDFGTLSNPVGSVVQVGNGLLYGMTQNGGVHHGGNIFSFDPVANSYSDLYDFPNVPASYMGVGSLIKAGNGLLYGMTEFGGSGPDPNGDGILFSFDPANTSNAPVTLVNFTGTGGAFPGENPYGSLVQATDGKLYGLTPVGGTNGYGNLFSYDPVTTSFADLVDFNTATGDNPYGDLMQATDGYLYGMTWADGTGGSGDLFSYDPVGKAFTDLIDFSTSNSGTIHGGANPYGSLVQASNDSLYGMTSDGGVNAAGNLFSFNPVAKRYIDLVDFGSTTQAGMSWGTVMHASNGLLYGITNSGGTGTDQFAYLGGDGTLYSFDPVSGKFTELYDLTSDASPYGNMMQSSNGLLYGMTFADGFYGRGTIFSLDPVTGVYADVFDFSNADGNGVFPYGSLIQASNGKLYGMTSTGGGVNNSGTGEIFSFDPGPGTVTPLYNFTDGTDGGFPFIGASLVQAKNGLLYGMTSLGGTGATAGCACGYGVIFSIDTLGHNYHVLWNFDGTHGGNPTGSLIQAGDGLLYGMTNGNNLGSNGVLFSVDASGNYKDRVDLDDNTGDNPYSLNGTLYEASDGNLYGGTTNGGTNSNGTVFQYNYNDSTFSVIRNLSTSDGARPFASFIELTGITTSAIVGSPFCAGASVTVSFVTNGTYNIGNIFTAQLSSANGSFASPVAIGTVAGTGSGTIHATIPANTMAGTGYRIRVVSSSPASNGTDNGSNIIINATVGSSITVNPDTICSGSSSLLMATGSSGNLQWQSSLTGSGFANINGADTSFYNTPPLSQATYYRLIAGNGICADTSTSLLLMVNPSPAPPVLFTNDSLICPSDSALITTGTYTTYIWNNGYTTSYTYAHEAGNYWVTVTNTYGCSAVSADKAISVFPPSSVSIDLHGDTLSSFGAISYQWYRNNVPIPNATSDIYVANESGSYWVAATDSNSCTNTSAPVSFTGITDLMQEQVSVFPNPSVDNWQLAVGVELVGSKLEIYDDEGRLVLRSEILNPRSGITADLPSGVYWLHISSNNINIMRKLVKL